MPRPPKSAAKSSLSYTSVGTPTVGSKAEMPSYNADAASDFGSFSMSNYSSYSNSVDDLENTSSGSVASTDASSTSYYDYNRKSGRRPKSDSESVDVSMSERSNCVQGSCCVHGTPCIIGQADTENESKTTEYEAIDVDGGLESPPRSYSTKTKSSKEKSGKVFKLHRPSDVSSKYYLSSSDTSCTGSTAALDPTHESEASTNGFVQDAASSAVGKTRSASTCSSVSSCQTACESANESQRPDEDAAVNSPDTQRPLKRERTATARAFYIGVQRKRDAEKFVPRCQNFRLYHRLPQKSNLDLRYIPDQLKLYIVYKDSKGGFVHYGIHRTPDQDAYYFIDVGDCTFPSLDILIRYYSIYVLLGIVTSSHEAEIFPPKVSKNPRRPR